MLRKLLSKLVVYAVPQLKFIINIIHLLNKLHKLSNIDRLEYVS